MPVQPDRPPDPAPAAVPKAGSRGRGSFRPAGGKVAVRQIREEDAPAFREVLDAVCRERRYLAMLEAPPLEQVRSFVAANVRSGHPQLVAEEDGRIVGWCDAIPGPAACGMAHVGRLGMGVLAAYRGRKIGRVLLGATLEKVRQLGLEKIELDVFSSNGPAIALYRSIGFCEEGRRKNGRFVDGTYDDVLLMALELRKPNQTRDPAPGSAAPAGAQPARRA
jgi:ribosomal protein S18 acetylase RimI-like enzyme